MTIATRILTVDDLWNMPGNGEGFELVKGELRPMPPSGHEHSTIGVNLITRINTFVQSKKLGKVTGADGGYVIESAPDTVRAPDIGFVQASRLPGGKRTTKFFKGAPDLAVEIVSPDDAYQDIDEKVKEYLEAGVRLVWVVNPRRKSVSVFRADNTISSLRPADVLSGEAVLLGFEIVVSDIFE